MARASSILTARGLELSMALAGLVMLATQGCDVASTQPVAAESKYEPLVSAAVKLIEEKQPLSARDPHVLAFTKQHPSVMGMLLVVDPKNRIALIRDESTSERIDERTRPIRGSLDFPDGTVKPFIELRRKCRYGDSEVTLLLRLSEGGTAH